MIRQKKHEVNEDELNKVGQMTGGLVGADIESIVNLAALQNVRKSYNEKVPPQPLLGSDLIQYVETYVAEKNRANQNIAPYQQFYR